MSANTYEQAAEKLLLASGCTVRKWRSRNTGTAYTDKRNRDWDIEVPRPRGPISFGVFAHEVAHQMLHRGNSKPRWIEEVEAEEYALQQFGRFGLAGCDRYRQAAAKHLAHTFAKAMRRGRPGLHEQIKATYPGWWDRALAASPLTIVHNIKREETSDAVT